MLIRQLCMALTLSLAAAGASATVIYENDFESGDLNDWSVLGTNPGITADDNGEHLLGLFNDNQTVTLTLALAAGGYRIGFDFFTVNSWDPVGGNCCFPDGFAVTINGVTVFDEDLPFTLAPTGSDTLAYTYPAGGNAGGKVGNARYRPTFDFLHGGGAFTLGITGMTDQPGQELGDSGFFDEPWALDNVLLESRTPAVPEPTTLALLAAGLLGARRRSAFAQRTPRG